ncbi:tetratricopeptide repeat protein, partial [Arthrobacter sp. ov118]|uniref:tetratricopeptide repeat protein n=1 Tax=Arthrobacter sp. ov118 TaxID=1761747 RepID=UPI0008EB171F
MSGPGSTGVELDRVVAVRATWADGRTEGGSGYLVTGRLVLTAGHCVRDKNSGKLAARIKLVRAGDGASASGGAVTVCPELDVAVIALGDDAPWEAELSGVVFARVDRSRAGMLEDCQGIGFPSFQRDAVGRATSEVHGTLYQTDGAESGQLLIRDPIITPGPLSAQSTPKIPQPTGSPPSPWGGFSGTTLFHHSLALGVVIEHHPAQGGSALRATAFDTIAHTAANDPEARKIADALGLPGQNNLAWAAAEPVEPLVGLVERLAGGDLPLVQDLNPYLAGATESRYGTKENAGTEDPYVARTHHDVDARLQTALVPGRMVLLVGPSKAGKTRTGFEAVRTTWPRARLLIPAPKSLATLAKHPRLQSSSDAVVVWLNDLQRYLTGITDPLTPALLTALLSRPGNTVVVATLRTEERVRLRSHDDELTREARRVLEEATEVELGPTSDNPAEQAAAQQTYPGQDLTTYGLAEQLAGAPYLLKQYRDARRADPLLHALVQTAIDWTRVGMPVPIPETDLVDLGVAALLSTRPDMDPTPEDISAKIVVARTPPEDAGRVASLDTVRLPDRTRTYRPFSYLVAADDGQTGEPRPIPDNLWDEALKRADIDAAFSVSAAAYERDNMAAAVRASQQAAAAGHTGAAFNLGVLLADRLDPPDLSEARRWYEQAAAAGHTGAAFNLGLLLADRLDPPDLEQARRWYGQAAAAGYTDAMNNLGFLLSDQTDPPDLNEARRWYEQAAAAG